MKNSRKEFEKFTENLQPLFRAGMLMQTKKSVE